MRSDARQGEKNAMVVSHVNAQRARDKAVKDNGVQYVGGVGSGW